LAPAYLLLDLQPGLPAADQSPRCRIGRERQQLTRRRHPQRAGERRRLGRGLFHRLDELHPGLLRPQRAQEGSGSTFNVPSGIAFTRAIYLPVIRR